MTELSSARPAVTVATVVERCRLREAGGVVTGTETTLFEWAERGDDPAFREVLALVKALP